MPVSDSYFVSRGDRRRWAQEHTHALSGRLWKVGGSMVTGALAFGALRAFGSEVATKDELIGAGAVAVVSLVLSPAAEYVRNYVRAGEQVATEKARELQLALTALEKERERARNPHVRLGEPYQKEHVAVTDPNGKWHGYANFVVVPVINDRGGVEARDVHASVSVERLDGEVLIKGVPARWAGDTPQSSRPHEPTNTARLAELTLMPNGRAHDLDTVMSFMGATVSFVWNNDSMKTFNPFIDKRLDDRYEIADRAFVVHVRVEGSNFEPLQISIKLECFTPAYRLLADDQDPLP